MTSILALVENVYAAMFSLDRTWRFTYINREGEKAVGKPREVLLGVSLGEILPELEGTVIGIAYCQAVETRLCIKIEEFYRLTQNWFEIHINPHESGLAVYLRDITIRKQFEAQLKESDRRLQFLTKVATEGILICENNRIVDANQALAVMFGYNCKEFIGMPFNNLLTSPTTHQNQDNFRADNTPDHLSVRPKSGKTERCYLYTR